MLSLSEAAVGRGRSGCGSKIALQPTCMWAFGVSTRRNEPSIGRSLVRILPPPSGALLGASQPRKSSVIPASRTPPDGGNLPQFAANPRVLQHHLGADPHHLTARPSPGRA